MSLRKSPFRHPEEALPHHRTKRGRVPACLSDILKRQKQGHRRIHLGITCRLLRYIPNRNWLHLNMSPPVRYLFFHKTDCTRLSDSKLSTDSPSLFSQKIMSKFFTARHALTQSSSYPYRHHASYTFHTGVSHIACRFYRRH